MLHIMTHEYFILCIQYILYNITHTAHNLCSTITTVTHYIIDIIIQFKLDLCNETYNCGHILYDCFKNIPRRVWVADPKFNKSLSIDQQTFPSGSELQ